MEERGEDRATSIGVDLDNTIVCYDRVIHDVAVEQGLIPSRVPRSKRAVRDYLRAAGAEERWIELQGFVYGPGMRRADVFAGVSEFFAACARRGVRVSIVSHRTRFPYRGPKFDLHEAARDFLSAQGWVGGTADRIGPDSVHLETTKEAKLRRIGALGCDCFIDDLPEFLDEPAFPSSVRRILFDPGGAHAEGDGRVRARSWDEITQWVSTLESRGGGPERGTIAAGSLS